MIDQFLSRVKALLLSIVAISNSSSQALRDENAALKSENAALKSEKATDAEALENGVTALENEFSAAPETPVTEPNPTPLEDLIVEAADKLPAPNTQEVQDALDNTVNTSEPTPPEAVESALGMILGAIDAGEDVTLGA